MLRVENGVGRTMIAHGEFFSYDLTVANTAKHAAASDIRVLYMLPAGFRFKNGSAQLNGISCPDPAVAADGQTLTFTVGTLAAEGSAAIRFLTEVTAVSKPGKAVSYASAFSKGGGRSNIAMASVQVSQNLPRAKADVSESASPVAAVAAAIPSPPLRETPQPLAPPPPESAPPAKGDNAADAQAAVTAGQDDAPPPVPPAVSVSKTTADKEKSPAGGRVDGGLTAPAPQNLAGLVGMTEISVLSDADGLFVQNLAKNQIVENESAGLVGETNLLASIYAGRNYSRDSHAASARTEQAKAQTGQALALLLPSVAVRANYGLEISNPSTDLKVEGADAHSRTDASLTVRQPLFDLPSFRDWQRRKVIEQARGENYRVSDGDTYISTANAYLSLVSSRLQIDMTRDFEVQLADLLSYIEKRANAGAASISDMARVRARRQATQSSRLEQESAHAAAGIEFVRLTNIVPKKVRIPELEDVGVSLLPKTLDMAVTAAMKSNPEIAALSAEMQAATIDTSAAKARYLPRVDAEYSNTYSLHAGGDTSSAGQKDQRLMMVLNWSLFSGGGDYHNHVERTARRKELQYRLDDQRRRVVQTLSANYATLATTRERIASGYQELKSISTAAEAMSKRMLSGNQSLLDLLDVYDRFYQVRSRLVSLHILEMNTVAQLVRITIGAPGPSSDAASGQHAGR